MVANSPPEIVVGPESWSQVTADLWADGAHIRLLPGQYPGPVCLSNRVSLSSADPHNRAVLLPGPSETGSSAALVLSGAQGGTVQDLEFRGLDFTGHRLLHILGGAWAVKNCRFQGAYEIGLLIDGPGAAPSVESCVIHGGTTGISVQNMARGTFLRNDILDHLNVGIEVSGAGTSPTVTGNGVQGGMQGGVLVRQGALGTFTENNLYDNAIANVMVRDRTTAPVFEDNQIRQGKRAGLVVCLGAGGIYRHNVISRCSASNVEVRDSGTSPTFVDNTVSDGLQAGISIYDGADGEFEDNNIFANGLANVFVYGKGTNPHIVNNTIHNGLHAGISIYGAAEGLYEDNEVYENAQANIQVAHIGTDPVFRRNRVHRGKQGGIFVQGGATGCFEENEVYDNALANVEVIDAGSRPIFRNNLIHSCLNEGIIVQNGAAGRFEGNEVRSTGFNTRGLGTTAAGYPSIRIKDPGSEPHFVSNLVSGSATAAFEISNGAGGFYEGNDIAKTDDNLVGFSKDWDIHWGTKTRRPVKKS